MPFHTNRSRFRRDFNPKERKGKERRNRNNDNPTKPLNNKRLEYLGDAVLETVVSDILFRHYPQPHTTRGIPDFNPLAKLCNVNR